VCGGENVFASLSLPAPGVSVEAVLDARPDAIVAGTDRGVRPAWLDDWKRWTTLPAVVRGNLYTVDANLLHRAGPRFLDGVEELCAVLDRARTHGR
jgi:iron complex transport system substrate-binding protein